MIRVFTSKTQALGEKGEQAAVSWLTKEGFSIVERNVANKYGEIDIIAKKKGTHHFFEVKTGKYGALISPAENLTEAKIHKFRISVEHYVSVHRIKEYQIQAIVVVLGQSGEIQSTEVFDLS